MKRTKLYEKIIGEVFPLSPQKNLWRLENNVIPVPES